MALPTIRVHLHVAIMTFEGWGVKPLLVLILELFVLILEFWGILGAFTCKRLATGDCRIGATGMTSSLTSCPTVDLSAWGRRVHPCASSPDRQRSLLALSCQL